MLVNRHYLYHPFKDSYFGMFLKNDTSFKVEIGATIDSLDLYHQPLQDPVIASISFTTRVAIIIIAEFIQAKVLVLIKKENGLVNDVARLYIISLMIGGPFLILFSSLIEFIHPASDVIGNWFCFVGSFMYNLCFYIMSFHSFVVALMRYFFIVHEQKVKKYGKEKVKRIFLFLSFLVPLALVVWNDLNFRELNAISVVNRCYGKDHKTFLIEASTSNATKPFLCKYEDFEKDAAYGELIPILRYVSCITLTFITVLIGFNLTECVIYYMTFSHIKR